MKDKTLSEFRLATVIIRLIVILICLIIGLSSSVACMFFVIATIPSLLFMYLDIKNEHKSMSATVCSFNLIGTFPYLMELLSSHQSINHSAGTIIFQLKTWIVIYGCAFIGRIIYAILPFTIAKFHLFKIERKRRNLRNLVKKISDEWGIM